LKQLKKEEYEEVCRRDEYFSHLDSIKKITSFMEKEAARENLQPGEYDTTFQYSGLKAFEI